MSQKQPKKKVKNKDFRFKQFTLRQEQCAMRFNTDSSILPAFLCTQDLTPNSILDIGHGSGVISLMLAQEFPLAKIYGIEKDPPSFEESVYNAETSPWKDRISFFLENFNELSDQFPAQSFDLIVSNPPYFSEQVHNPDPQKNDTRRTNSLPFSTLIQNSEKMLTEKGHFTVIIPNTEVASFTTITQTTKLNLIKQVLIRHHDDSIPKRYILIFQKNAPTQEVEEVSIILKNKENEYTPQMVELLKPFFLHL